MAPIHKISIQNQNAGALGAPGTLLHHIKKGPKIYMDTGELFWSQLHREAVALEMVAENAPNTDLFPRLIGRLHDGIVIEYFALGDVGSFIDAAIKKQVELSRATTLHILWSVTMAVAHLEKMGFVHGDIKLENLFIDNTGRVVLGDFGEVLVVGRETLRGGIPMYMCKEHLNGDKADSRFDRLALVPMFDILLRQCRSATLYKDRPLNHKCYKGGLLAVRSRMKQWEYDRPLPGEDGEAVISALLDQSESRPTLEHLANDDFFADHCCKALVADMKKVQAMRKDESASPPMPMPVLSKASKRKASPVSTSIVTRPHIHTTTESESVLTQRHHNKRQRVPSPKLDNDGGLATASIEMQHQTKPASSLANNVPQNKSESPLPSPTSSPNTSAIASSDKPQASSSTASFLSTANKTDDETVSIKTQSAPHSFPPCSTGKMQESSGKPSF
ncbi:kinase-like domain-containing protein, partial [Catenaria anguillulae PL171]